MAPTRLRKQFSSPSPIKNNDSSPIKPRDSNPSTPQRSPIKRRKAGVTSRQKQALINHLQLEITERARRLRAQYHLQAQGLRSRIEMRINRIPPSLRKAKMGDLLVKCLEQEKRPVKERAPPVPAKDFPVKTDGQRKRVQKRLSEEISRDKENNSEHMDNPKKRARGAPDAAPVRPGQVLSPTSSNSRVPTHNRPASPTKTAIARPASPLKTAPPARAAAATSVLANMVEKAKATRAGGATRKVTTAETTASRARRTGAAAASRAPPSRPATRTGRRVSDNSETSEGSAATVSRKAQAKPPPPPKRTVMSTIKRGVAGAGKKAAASAKPAAATSSTGRVLRRRG